ncbi:MAG TPA: MFS transporter [Ktedonobacterales bacterium]|jgi:MFS family permease
MDSITAGASAPSRKPGLLINRDYAFLWLGQSISFMGDMMLATTLVIWIATGLGAHQSWAPIAVSAVLIATAAPTLLVGVFAGVFVDRARKRPLMLWMDALRTVIVAALVVASGVFPLPFIAANRLPLVWTLGLIYGVVVLVNIGEQFFRPSAMALVQEIVPTELQARAMGLSQASISIALIIGPSVAAPLYAVFGPEWAILIDAASYAISFLTILAIREPRAALAQAAQHGEAAQRASFWRELLAGARFYFSNRVLVTLLAAVVVAMVGASALNTLDVFFATENLHATTAMYGLLGGAMGLGSIVGSIVFGFLAQRIGLARTLWMTMAAFGVLVAFLSRTTNYDLALGLFVVAGVLNAALNIAAGPMMMRETPNHLMGRVMSIFQPAMSLAILVGTALVGYLAGVSLRGFHAVALGQTFGAVDTIWLGGGALMFLSGVMIMIGLTGVDRRYRAEDRAAKAASAQAVAEPAIAEAPEVAEMIH